MSRCLQGQGPNAYWPALRCAEDNYQGRLFPGMVACRPVAQCSLLPASPPPRRPRGWQKSFSRCLGSRLQPPRLRDSQANPQWQDLGRRSERRGWGPSIGRPHSGEHGGRGMGILWNSHGDVHCPTPGATCQAMAAAMGFFCWNDPRRGAVFPLLRSRLWAVQAGFSASQKSPEVLTACNNPFH